jgi:O-methyltransferase
MNIDSRSPWSDPSFIEKTGGLFPKNEKHGRRIPDFPVDTTRRDVILLMLKSIEERRVPGEMAEFGVYQGDSARLIHAYLPVRKLYLFDTFHGFTDEDIEAEREKLGILKEKLAYFPGGKTRFSDSKFAAQNLSDWKVFVCPGHFPESITREAKQEVFAFVHLDSDLYESILSGLIFFYPRMAQGGIILIHDYNSWLGTYQAVNKFFEGCSEVPIPMPDKNGSVVVVKQ